MKSTIFRFIVALAITISCGITAYAYHNISPYAWCAGNPVVYVDPDGKEIRIKTNSGSYLVYKDSELLTSQQEKYSENDQYAINVQLCLNDLEKDEILKNKIEDLEKSDQIHCIEDTNGYNENQVENGTLESKHLPTGSTTRFNYAGYETLNGDKRTPAAGLAHELLGHGWDANFGKTDFGKTNGIKNYEINAIKIENRARLLFGDPQRTEYKGIKIIFK